MPEVSFFYFSCRSILGQCAAPSMNRYNLQMILYHHPLVSLISNGKMLRRLHHFAQIPDIFMSLKQGVLLPSTVICKDRTHHMSSLWKKSHQIEINTAPVNSFDWNGIHPWHEMHLLRCVYCPLSLSVFSGNGSGVPAQAFFIMGSTLLTLSSCSQAFTCDNNVGANFLRSHFKFAGGGWRRGGTICCTVWQAIIQFETAILHFGM